MYMHCGRGASEVNDEGRGVPIIDIREGAAPLVLNVPHDGREIPAAIGARMTAEALALPDTDWHMRDLWGFAADLGATVVSARYSRYVVDLNRPPDGRPLYPGADNTGVCPTTTFLREPVYRPGAEPDDAETRSRIRRYWRPYHAELARVVADKRDRFGSALLFDAHSIRSVLPRFFEGRLPEFNFGTADGASADAALTERMFGVLDRAEGYGAVLDGRFKGGYITRHYGAPADGVHAVQLEMAQSAYMEEESPYRLLPDRAALLRPVLEELLEAGLDWVSGAGRARAD